MGVVQLVNSFESVSGLPEDRFQNVVHVSRNAEPTIGEMTTLCQVFRDFFQVAQTGMSTFLANYISGVASRASNQASVSGYYTSDFSGDTPFGSPIATVTYTLAVNASGNDLPEEVAAVISYAGDLTDVPVSQANPSPPPATIRPQSRRRGRLFVGPLEQVAGSTQAGFFRPSPTFRTDATIAFREMAEAFNAIANTGFGVWSRLDETLYPAETAYMDDAWDTQRRRGPAATTRTAVTIT